MSKCYQKPNLHVRPIHVNTIRCLPLVDALPLGRITFATSLSIFLCTDQGVSLCLQLQLLDDIGVGGKYAI